MFSHSHHMIPMQQEQHMILFIPSTQKRNWGTERLSDLSKIVPLVSGMVTRSQFCYLHTLTAHPGLFQLHSDVLAHHADFPVPVMLEKSSSFRELISSELEWGINSILECRLWKGPVNGLETSFLLINYNFAFTGKKLEGTFNKIECRLFFLKD